MNKNYIVIGKFFKPVGTDGELKFDLDEEYIDDFVAGDHFFVQVDGCFVPFFIENLREVNSFIIKIEEVDNPESASFFSQKEIFLRASSIISRSPEKVINHKDTWVGYLIFNGKKEVGIIMKIEKFPQQTMAWVDVEGRLIPIPLAEPMITGIDHEQKSVCMELPHGILDM